MKRTKLLAATLALAGSPLVNAYEEPRFEVLTRQEGFELRRYAPYVVAEVTAAGDFDGARSEAFQLLFAYISGRNQAQQGLAMTAPVTSTQASAGQRMAMTVPVTSTPRFAAGAAAGYVTQFVLPSQFSLDSAPLPTDARVSLRLQEARLVAVRTYSGRSNEANYRDNEASLLMLAKAAGYAPAGEPVAAVYNGPFTPWFLRRNEVMLPVRGNP